MHIGCDDPSCCEQVGQLRHAEPCVYTKFETEMCTVIQWLWTIGYTVEAIGMHPKTLQWFMGVPTEHGKVSVYVSAFGSHRVMARANVPEGTFTVCTSP